MTSEIIGMKVNVEEGASISGEVKLDIADSAFSEESITVSPGTVNFVNKSGFRST